jgi:predicted short-subunit dehydrogenase-like oxidoreductase (DUF2520 family)
MLTPSMKRTLSIVGAGRVGRTLGKRMRERGWRIGAVVTRSRASAETAVRVIGAGAPLARISPEVLAADVILITTPDDSIPEAVQQLAQIADASLKNRIVLHASATLDKRALAPLAKVGAATGSLHPMQAFGGKVIPNLRGVIFGIEGDAKARRSARSIAKSLGGIPVEIATRDKAIYHAAAVIGAGSTYALVETGIEMLMRIGFTRERAMQTLLPLTRQIFDNIGRIGPCAAWTGPLSRGDYKIVARHARALRGYPREFREAYAALSLLSGRVLARNPHTMLKRIKKALADG